MKQENLVQSHCFSPSGVPQYLGGCWPSSQLPNYKRWGWESCQLALQTGDSPKLFKQKSHNCVTQMMLLGISNVSQTYGNQSKLQILNATFGNRVPVAYNMFKPIFWHVIGRERWSQTVFLYRGGWKIHMVRKVEKKKLSWGFFKVSATAILMLYKF